MRAHAGYWNDLLAQGIAVAFGPVAEPNGMYGLGTIQMEASVDSPLICAEDPAIKAQAALRYQVHGMPRLLVRQEKKS